MIKHIFETVKWDIGIIIGIIALPCRISVYSMPNSMLPVVFITYVSTKFHALYPINTGVIILMLVILTKSISRL